MGSEILAGGYLSDNVAVDQAYAYASANTTTLTSAEFDMAGYAHLLAYCWFGTAATNNTFALWASATASGEAATVATMNSATLAPLILDVTNVALRYIKLTMVRGTSTTLEQVVLVRYGARSKAVAQAATVKVSQFNAPALV